ncbi:MAG: Clp protease N-terminal domain-containing protein [Solirubrobacteraceae bacterium]
MSALSTFCWGLLREDDGGAARVLASFDVTLDRARVQVVRLVGSGEGPPTFGPIPFTPRARQVLARAGEEAVELGHRYIGTEHILLALASVGEGEAMNALQVFGLDAEQLRRAVIELLSKTRPIAPASILRVGRRRGARGPRTEASVPAGGLGVEQRSYVVRLLMSAGSRALEDGRTQMTGEDVLIALTRDQRTASVLAELGVNEAAIREALARRAGARGGSRELTVDRAASRCRSAGG